MSDKQRLQLVILDDLTDAALGYVYSLSSRVTHRKDPVEGSYRVGIAQGDRHELLVRSDSQGRQIIERIVGFYVSNFEHCLAMKFGGTPHGPASDMPVRQHGSVRVDNYTAPVPLEPCHLGAITGRLTVFGLHRTAGIDKSFQQQTYVARSEVIELWETLLRRKGLQCQQES